MKDRLLTAKEVADLLAVPESWVREGTREGRIPHLKLGRYRRYQPAAIEAWLAEQGGLTRRTASPHLRSGRG
jgi:excisionase family DNA binding protein